MDIRFQNTAGAEWRAECALVLAFAGKSVAANAPTLWQSSPWLEITPALRDFSGKKDELALLYGHPDLALPRVLAIGLGKAEKFTLNIFRAALAKAVAYCRSRGFATLGLPVEVLDALAGTAKTTREILLKEAVIASLLSLYRCDDWRSKKAPSLKNVGEGIAENGENDEDDNPDPRSFSLFFSENEMPSPARKAAREGEAEAAGILLARRLANGPANHITPAVLAEEAQKLAREHGFTCTVLDGRQIRDLGMGALWAVARGAKEEPRFIILEHCPAGKEGDDPVIVAGKGITFDTGGISLKPAAKMHEMKGDMGGAAAVLGFFKAVAHLPDADTLPRIIGLIPSAENMPGGNATRPGDVVTTLSGKTVEILNTDAEGRLILCDALTYAQKEWKPRAIIDLATLTGACVVALGDYGTGLFTNDGKLRHIVMDAADATGDLVWPMPLWEEYDANLKSDVADMANIGPREGGAIHAALFLQRFIEKGTRWVHLDIAGPGYVVKANPLHPVPGGTGVGVRILCDLMRRTAF